MNNLEGAMETGGRWSSNRREVGTIPNSSREYLFPSKAAIAMTELSRCMFYYVVRRNGIKPSGGTGKAHDPFLWSVASINEINKVKRSLRSFKEPRREWGKDPISEQAVEL